LIPELGTKTQDIVDLLVRQRFARLAAAEKAYSDGNRVARPNPDPSLQICFGDTLLNGTGRGTIGRAAPSRGRYDAQIYTNDKSELAQHLSRDVSHRTAIQTGQQHELEIGQKVGPSSVGHDAGQEHGVAPQSHGHTAGEGQGQAVGE